MSTTYVPKPLLQRVAECLVVRLAQSDEEERCYQSKVDADLRELWSTQMKADIVAGLRKNNQMTLSLVAEFEERVVAHIAFSPVNLSDGSSAWFALGPLAVVHDMRGLGIGTALVDEGLDQLRDKVAAGCIALDVAFLQRWGFKRCPSMQLDSQQHTPLIAVPFFGQLPSGTVTYPAPFEAAWKADRARRAEYQAQLQAQVKRQLEMRSRCMD